MPPSHSDEFERRTHILLDKKYVGLGFFLPQPDPRCQNAPPPRYQKGPLTWIVESDGHDGEQGQTEHLHNGHRGGEFVQLAQKGMPDEKGLVAGRISEKAKKWP